MPSSTGKNRKKVWDQTPWEPTAWQQTVLGLGVSWVASLIIENFLLERTDVWDFIRGLGISMIGFRFDADFWTAVFLWIVLPAIFFFASMAVVKKLRRYILLICTVVFTGLLVFVEISGTLK